MKKVDLKAEATRTFTAGDYPKKSGGVWTRENDDFGVITIMNDANETVIIDYNTYGKSFTFHIESGILLQELDIRVTDKEGRGNIPEDVMLRDLDRALAAKERESKGPRPPAKPVLVKSKPAPDAQGMVTTMNALRPKAVVGPKLVGDPIIVVHKNYDGTDEEVDFRQYCNVFTCPLCGGIRYVKKADLFQVKACKPCTKSMKKKKKATS